MRKNKLFIYIFKFYELRNDPCIIRKKIGPIYASQCNANCLLEHQIEYKKKSFPDYAAFWLVSPKIVINEKSLEHAWLRNRYSNIKHTHKNFTIRKRKTKTNDGKHKLFHVV